MFLRPRLNILVSDDFRLKIFNTYKNEQIQMCREISVAETFISYLKFHTKLRLEYLLCLKKIRLCLVNQSFLYLLEIRNRSFATRILSFTTMVGSTTCGPQLVFARLILKNSANFSRVTFRLTHAQFMRFTL